MRWWERGRESEEEGGRERRGERHVEGLLRSTDDIENERLSHEIFVPFSFPFASIGTNILGWLNSKLVTVNW